MTVDDWAEIALIGAFVAAIGTIFADCASRRSVARALYWTCAYIAVSCLALAMVPMGWHHVIVITAFGTVAAVGYAYFETPFIKIKGRIYAAEVRHARPDPADGEQPDLSPPREIETYDGRHSAAVVWWLMAAGACLTAFGLIVTRWRPELFVLVAIGAAIAGFFGLDDGSRGFPYARGHLLPFRIAAAASLVGAGIPLWCYLYGYRRGSRNPGYGKHDAARQRLRKRRRGR
ncbi:hypothetical protein ACWDUN_22165 [Mycobacterium sp. NPDC003323]